MHQIVRTTLEIYLREKRIATLSDFHTDISLYTRSKESVFVTLYYQGKVVASSGRISCKKENTLFECIDNTLMCLKDTRLSAEIQDASRLSDIHIRVDRFSTADRRVLQKISDLDTKSEGVIFLSQNLWLMSVILPNMVHIDSSPDAYFQLACKKIGVEFKSLSVSDYVLYALKTQCETDFWVE